MNYYKDKVVVITGGAKGIGSETAKLLSSLDAIIYVLDIEQTIINELNKSD
jgi:NAD(P)-dependent dehydrogenase (short-subunit alcohol dehydrogenase family)